MRIVLVNPLNESEQKAARTAERLASLAGSRIGLLDISKPGGSVFLDRLELNLKERYGVGEVVREIKPTFTKPAPDTVIERFKAAKVDAVIEALAD